MNTPARSLLRHARLFGASLLFAATALVSSAQTHTVNFTTPWEIGQRYTASATVSESNQMVVSQGETILQQQGQKRTARLEADAEALGNFPHGGLRKAAFTIRSLHVSIDDAAETEFLPAGTKVVVESQSADKEVFTINDLPASDEQAAILKLVISTDDPEHSDQIMFGPKQPVAVGESWQPDVQAMQSSLGKDLGVSANITGTMKLDAIEGAGPKQVSVVSGDMTFDNFIPPMPPGITPKSGKMTMKLDGRIPAARSASTRIENLTMLAEFSGEATPPNGATVTLKFKAETKSSHTLTFP